MLSEIDQWLKKDMWEFAETCNELTSTTVSETRGIHVADTYKFPDKNLVQWK
jgi:hypothetical protein